MGVEYYGILFEDKYTIIAVRLSSSYPDESVHERAADTLLKLFNEAPLLLRALEEEDNVTNYNSIYALTRIAKLVDDATVVTHVSAVLYLAFCKYFGIKPRIVSEYTLFPESGKRKRVCILGERCYT